MKVPSFHVRAKINNVFWCYISFTKNGALVPGARYVNPIENALTPSGRRERARKGKERRGLAWPRSRGARPGARAGSRYVSLHFCILLCIFMHWNIFPIQFFRDFDKTRINKWLIMHVIWKPTEIGRFVCLIMNGLTVTANFYFFFTLVFAMTSILAPWLLNIFFFFKKILLVTTVAGPVIIEICGQGPRHRPPVWRRRPSPPFVQCPWSRGSNYRILNASLYMKMFDRLEFLGYL